MGEAVVRGITDSCCCVASGSELSLLSAAHLVSMKWLRPIGCIFTDTELIYVVTVALCNIMTPIPSMDLLGMLFHWVCVSLGNGAGESDGTSFPHRHLH